MPSLLLLNTEGVICAIDPSLSDWFDYRPKKNVTTEQKEEPVKVDLAIAQASSPLQHLSQGRILLLKIRILIFLVLIYTFPKKCELKKHAIWGFKESSVNSNEMNTETSP